MGRWCGCTGSVPSCRQQACRGGRGWAYEVEGPNWDLSESWLCIYLTDLRELLRQLSEVWETGGLGNYYLYLLLELSSSFCYYCCATGHSPVVKLWAVYPEGECRTETCDLQKEPPLGLRRGFPCLFLAEEEPKHC